MLESEYEELRAMHPEYARRWDAVLKGYAHKRGLPDAFAQWGLWRWRALPPKMRELCRDGGSRCGTIIPCRQNLRPLGKKRLI